MNSRIQEELNLLKKRYSKVDYIDKGKEQWVRIGEYPIPPNLPWNRQKTDVCFKICLEYPGTAPYGFFVPSGILYEGNLPNNYKDPPNECSPFPGKWGFFSWVHDNSWRPTADLKTGSNLTNFAGSFQKRFLER